MGDQKFNNGDYVEVAERIREFRQAHPDGALRPVDPAVPYRIETLGDQTFIVVVAAAYRDANDQNPGIGMAWERFPGKTNFTRDSELMNAETSAWGRAIVAALAADTKRGVASADEVRARAARAAAGLPAADFARAKLMRLCNARGIDPNRVAAEFKREHGIELRTATDDAAIEALLHRYQETA
ncbi:hypothetical protein [Nocardia sp. CC227C]|uniref:hypothetical protein n=1 Tax=Nocardia sp. CC227C TaxID=3044562 RepID=UPI00278C62F5|nr:hypothetical protein [Nocardia sp. CC227C]